MKIGKYYAGTTSICRSDGSVVCHFGTPIPKDIRDALIQDFNKISEEFDSIHDKFLRLKRDKEQFDEGLMAGGDVHDQ